MNYDRADVGGGLKGEKKENSGKEEKKWTFGRGGKVKSPYVLVCTVYSGAAILPISRPHSFLPFLGAPTIPLSPRVISSFRRNSLAI